MLHAQQDEEFQEADILWPDAPQGRKELLPQVYYYSHTDSDDDDDRDEFFGERRPMKLQIGQRPSSPIEIPGRKGGAKGAKAQPGFSSKLGGSRTTYSTSSGGGGSVMIGSHVFVPPHVIVDRRAKKEKAMMMFVVPSRKATKIGDQLY